MAAESLTGRHVAIVGAGPGGAMLALLLARGGVRVTLIERHTDFAREFRGEGVNLAGIDVLRQAGLLDRFMALPAAPVRTAAFYARGRQFLSLDIADLFDADQFVRLTPQPPFLEMLIEEASRHPGFTFLRGEAVLDLVRDGGRVTGVRLHERDLAADFVVAADGRFSHLRKLLGRDLEGEPQFFDVIWCKVPRPPLVPPGRICGFLLAGVFGLALPAVDDELQLGRIIPKGSFAELRHDPEHDWAALMADSLPGVYRAGFEAVRGDVKPVLLDVMCGAMADWSEPGLVFMGDAAHPMSPVGAQGINIALRDAAVLANHLGPLLVAGAEGAALDEAAKAFQAERRQEIEAVQKEQNRVPRQLVWATHYAGLLRFVPDSFIQWLARRFVSGETVQRFARGAVEVTVEFGRS